MQRSTKLRWGLGLGAGVLVAGALAGKAVLDHAQATAQGYLFGYPLVLMEVTQRYMIEANNVPLNRMHHMRQFPDASFRSVVSPNADTLYSTASLDLSSEPVVMHIPDMQGRYYMMPIMDAWTNVYASPGSRTYPDGPRDYLIAGPGWKGEVPPGMALLQSPTNLAWMIGRITSSGPSDYAEVHAQQDGMSITPLSAWLGTSAPKQAAASWQPPAIDKRAPDQQLPKWSSTEFFTTVCNLMRANPPRSADAPALQQLRDAGLLTDTCTLDQSPLQQLGTWIGYRKVIAALNDTDNLIGKMPSYNGWRVPYDIGEYGTDYPRRAMVAKFGLGANLNEDAIYPSLRRDTEERPLSGEYRYVLHFDKAQLPAVKGFWSLTLYDQNQFFVANPINRFAIGDRDRLHYNADGSLDLYIQADAPTQPEQMANWLPAPKENFNIILRLYWPEQAILDKSWQPPAIKRLD